MYLQQEVTMKHLNTLDWITLILAIIGGLNWGLVGFFGFNLVSAILGDMTIASRVVYAAVGLSALYWAVISPSLIKRPAHYVEHRAVPQAR
jgi:uncharacterized protein